MTMENLTEAGIAEQVAAVWANTLNLKSVPHDAHFLSLGGNSLLLLSIITHMENEFGVELDVDELVADLTVEGMARVVVGVAR